MTSYVPISAHPTSQNSHTAESRFWHAFSSTSLVRFPIAPSRIALTPSTAPQNAPCTLAIAAGPRVHLYRTPQSDAEQFSRFADAVSALALRADGKLVAAGTLDCAIKLIEASSRTQLRQLDGHTRALRDIAFLTATQLASVSDDATLRYWDVATGSNVSTVDAATDYVRSVAVSPHASDLLVTGAYDHHVSLWDVRHSSAVRKIDVGRPVEQVVWLSSQLVAVAASTLVHVVDVVQGKTVLSMENHGKTVTSLAVGKDRLLAAGLDGIVKVYDLHSPSLEVVHTMRYDAPVTGLAYVDHQAIVTLHSDASAIIKLKRSSSSSAAAVANQVAKEAKKELRAKGVEKEAKDKQVVGVVEKERKKKLAPYDRYLRQFEFAQALDAALETRNPAVVVALIEELSARNGLEIALANRDEAGIEPLMAFLAKHVVNPAYADVLLGVTEHVLTVYASVLGVSAQMDDCFFRLKERLREEVKHQRVFGELRGQIECLLAQNMLEDLDTK